LPFRTETVPWRKRCKPNNNNTFYHIVMSLCSARVNLQFRIYRLSRRYTIILALYAYIIYYTRRSMTVLSSFGSLMTTIDIEYSNGRSLRLIAPPPFARLYVYLFIYIYIYIYVHCRRTTGITVLHCARYDERRP